MRILAVSQWFPPEPGGGPARFLEMAKVWQEAGHEVHVLAGLPNWPMGRIHPEYRSRLRIRERYEGLSVTRAWVYAAPNEGVVKRVLNHTSFLASAPLVQLLERTRPDVVVATSPPMFAAPAGLAIARWHRRPFVFDVRDLWPDAIFALGQMRQRPVRRALRALERHLYRAADAVVAVTDRFVDPILERGARRVEVIPNGADTSFFAPGPPDPELRARWGWDDRFVVLYAGTIGMAHGLSTVIDAAERLRDTNVLFSLVGEGADKRALADQAARRGVDNVQFLPLQSRELMPTIYRSADAGLIALRPLPLFDAFIPSKLFEIMSCGRPVFASVSGEARGLVEEAGAGFRVEPGSGGSLADSVREAIGSGTRLEQMGRRGREFVEGRFDRRELAHRYIDLLRSLVGHSS